ncbi:MAG: hypothetical protein HY287_08160 [Planctomycetes bacterium]|nr:hypothetical protein [Planctomycetota bacterium]MBI3834287.1 hypothetical protein [Planctomycetota bacterium]
MHRGFSRHLVLVVRTAMLSSFPGALAADPPAANRPGIKKEVGPSNLQVDRSGLDAIQRPQRWTAEEIQNYIKQVLEVSSRTHDVWESDPQIRMLSEVGYNNIQYLFEAMGSTGGVADAHLEKAIKHLFQDSHRELLRKYLPFNPSLASIVVARDWQEDFRELLIAGLYRDESLSPDWLQAVGRIENPRVTPALERYMANGESPNAAYEALKGRNDPSLDEAVRKAWRAIGTARRYRLDYFSPVAARHGEVDALTHLAHLVEKPSDQYDQATYERALRELIPYNDTAKDLTALVLENPGRLDFDPQKHEYTVH